MRPALQHFDSVAAAAAAAAAAAGEAGEPGQVDRGGGGGPRPRERPVCPPARSSLAGRLVARLGTFGSLRAWYAPTLWMPARRRCCRSCFERAYRRTGSSRSLAYSSHRPEMAAALGLSDIVWTKKQRNRDGETESRRYIETEGERRSSGQRGKNPRVSRLLSA